MLPDLPRSKLFLGSSGWRRFDGGGSVALETAFLVEKVVLRLTAAAVASGKKGIGFGHGIVVDAEYGYCSVEWLWNGGYIL